MKLIDANKFVNFAKNAKWFVAAVALTHVAASHAEPAPKTSGLSLQTYLEKVSQNNALVQAARLQKQAAQLKRHAGDLEELSPFLRAGTGLFYDNSETSMPNQQGTLTEGKQYSFEVAKAFSTGTAVSVKWGQIHTDTVGTVGFTIEPRWESRYEVGVTQSLWKNAFGRGTRLRHTREDAMTKLALLQAESDERQALIKAEEAYWDLVVQTIDVKEKSVALQRVQRTRDWTAKRLENGIADKADLLQIDALLNVKRMEELASNDKLEMARKAYQDALGGAEQATGLPMVDALSVVRPLANKVDSLRIDMWAQQHRAVMSEALASETTDKLRPDLSLGGSFGANARDTALGTSAGNAFASDQEFYKVGLNFSMSLDFGLKNDLRAAASAEAKAARLVADKLGRDAAHSYQEITRMHRELSAKIEVMEKLAKIQDAKLAREQERLRIGRTTTAQVTNFEQEVADFRVSLLQAKAGQRKLEAQAQMYLSRSEVEAL